MNKVKFYLSAALGLFMATTFVACDNSSDDPTPTPTDPTPVIDVNFKYEVKANTVTFTSLYAAGTTVSWLNVATKATSSESVFVTTISQKGDYKFVFSVMVDGTFYPSDTFKVTIAQDDLSFLNYGYWKLLTGGQGKTKTWKMDINKDGECKYFDGPLYYSGTDTNPYWAWDVLSLPYTLNGTEMTTYFNWSPKYSGNTWLMSAQDYGTITFKGDDKTVSTSKFGVAANGTFTFDTATMKMVLAGVTFPTDTQRINAGQFTDLYNVRIFSLSDSAMQVGIKRVYEGTNTDGTPKESKWTHVYNFIVDGYTYIPETFTYTEPVKTTAVAADLVGTWVYDAIAFDWIGWPYVGTKGSTANPRRLNSYTDNAGIVATGWAATQAQLDAANAKTFVFNADGSCVLAGVKNTYKVSNGVITFGTALADELTINSINMSGATIKVVDVWEGTGAETGIWLGNQNGTNNESSCVHLVKKATKKRK
jgi:hypothetical protein